MVWAILGDNMILSRRKSRDEVMRGWDDGVAPLLWYDSYLTQ